jgi:biopolymer transport protein ExbB
MNPIIDFGEIIIYIALAFASIIAVTVIIERVVVFYQNGSKHVGIFINELIEKLHKHDIEEALRYASEFEPNVYQRFANYALTHYNAGHEGLNQLMEGQKVDIRVELEKHMSILGTLGNNAPFIGLLGTVLGVIKAFYGLGTLGNVGAEVVMRSISSALTATAAGLAVAIPVVIANNYFSTKTKVIMQKLEFLSNEFTASYFHRNKKLTKNDNHS